MPLYHWKLRRTLKYEGSLEYSNIVLERDMHCIVPPSLGASVSLFSLILEDTREAQQVRELESRMHLGIMQRLTHIDVEGIRLHEGSREIVVESSIIVPDQASLAASVEYYESALGFHTPTIEWSQSQTANEFEVHVSFTLFGPDGDNRSQGGLFHKTTVLPIVPARGMGIRFGPTAGSLELTEASISLVQRDFTVHSVWLGVDVESRINNWHEDPGVLKMRIDASAESIEDFLCLCRVLQENLAFQTF
jgi:hypothetical protein